MRVLGVPACLAVVHARIVRAVQPHLALGMHLHVLTERRIATIGHCGSGEEQPRPGLVDRSNIFSIKDS